MLPTIPVGPLRFQTYGLFLLLAYFAGLWCAARAAKRHGLDPDHIYNAGFFALLVGFVAARLAHAIAYFEVYRADLRQILSLSPGAFLPLVGLLAAVGAVAVYIHRHRMSWPIVLDAAATGLLLGVAIASSGAFLSGHTQGTASTVPWAVESFGLSRHPVAMYETLAALALLGGLLWLDRRGRLRPGQLALMALFGYATMRLFLEPLHAASATVGSGWRLPQIAALMAVLLSGIALGRVSRSPLLRHTSGR